MTTNEQTKHTVERELSDWRSNLKNRLSFPEATLTALVSTRFRYVLWVLLALSVIGILKFGFQDAGSYYGYEAGSLFRPERYVDTAWTASFGDAYGFTAADINGHLSSMRLASLPGVLGCGVVLIGTVALTFWAGLGTVISNTVWETLFKADGRLQKYFLDCYRFDHPAAPAKPDLDDVALYAWQYVFSAGCDAGVPGTVIDAEMVQQMRTFLGDVKLCGGYLALNGLRVVSSPMRLVALLPAISVCAPTVAAPDALRPKTAVDADNTVAEAEAKSPVPREKDVDAGSGESACPNSETGTDDAADATVSESDGEDARERPKPEGAAVRFCPQCGRQLPGEAKFCPRCGASLGGSRETHTAKPEDTIG